MPKFYNESVRSLLQGSVIGEEGAAQHRRLEQTWTVFCRSYTNVCRSFSFDEFAWAWEVVGTRAFDLDVLMDAAKASARGDARKPKRAQARGTKGGHWTGLVSVLRTQHCSDCGPGNLLSC